MLALLWKILGYFARRSELDARERRLRVQLAADRTRRSRLRGDIAAAREQIGRIDEKIRDLRRNT